MTRTTDSDALDPECPGPDEGDAESGPPDSITPCCPRHFPGLDWGDPPEDDAPDGA